MDRSTRTTVERIWHWSAWLFDPVIGFAILAPAPIVLFGFAFLGAAFSKTTPGIAGLLVVVTVILAIAVWFEWKGHVEGSPPALASPMEDSRTVFAVIAGTIATLAITAEASVSSIVAAGVVAVIAVFVVPRYNVPVYCGGFVGMTSPELFTTHTQAVLAGLLAGGTFVVVRSVFNGFGGNLGTTAFVAAVPVVALTAAGFHSDPLPSPTTTVLAVTYAMLAAMVTWTLSVRFDRGPVLASGSVGVIGGLLLPIAYPSVGWLLAGAVFCASFVGMASPDRIGDEIRIGIAGAIAGLVVVYTSPYLGGSGGKLGTIAFGSCLCVWGIDQLRST